MTVTKSGTAAHALVAQLEELGVEHVFGTCGHTNIAVLDALADSRIHFVIARHEQAAAHAADGYARVSGKPGVLLVHVGPGLTNAATGVMTAALDSVPMVVISGDIPSYYHGRHPHQEINLHADADQASVFRPFVKRAWNVHRAQDVGRFVERAFWTATSGRPGATLVNVPMDVFSRPAEPFPAISQAASPGLPQATAELIAARLAAAEQPLIYVGGGLREDTEALRWLAEHLDIPIAHSLMAKGTVPDAHPLLLGMPGFWGLELTNTYAREADVVLALATRFAETDASSWDPRFTWDFSGNTLIQIDIDPAELGRNYPAEIGAVADVRLAVQAIAVAAASHPARSRPELRKQILEARSELFTASQERGGSEDFPLRPERILKDLREALPLDAVLVTDVGWNKNGVAQCYELPAEGRFITPGGASTMGFGPAAAIGVQLAEPDRTVIALIGDGGMSAQLPALPMAVEQDAPVVFVVMNNRSHGTISDLQSAHYGRSYGCDFADPAGHPYSPDFASLARACGADGHTVATPSDLGTALREAIANRRPAVIDVPMVNEPVPTPGHWNIKDIYQGLFID
ncbi:thiamine pyrophosphate-binding protein [Nonomuraea sp. KC401]|uniref:thiamine pyrophosphate-binding protein n=1 Tax=unclassified Nonomuraea TaxID=2593643 RepID=UPI0010FE1867|nr:thiamine pyrophosphate-binding protein [Nonomuraea sp. KC401]NBF00150.1 thiamine pyrophosphate-binding protein [Nonomuraea sp. K271]TLF53642.1 thiamine pyrophosphate-binding protein [Nonomuraea sp. KC401]